MRIGSLAMILALVLIPAAASAQDEDGYVPPPRNRGEVDLGARTTRITGDGARYERYRDLADGLFLETVRVDREQAGWFFQLTGDHVGRQDQRLGAAATKPGQFSIWGLWDQIPLLLSRSTQTLYQDESVGVLRIPDTIQAQVQNNNDRILTFFPQFGRSFDLQTRRDVAQGGLEYLPTTDLSIKLNLRRVNREGAIPYGGSFGHSSFAEMAAPIRHELTDFDGVVEYSNGNALYRGGYTLSWFNNDVTQLVWDNPFSAASIVGASSVGRTAAPPSNTWFTVNAMASYRLPRRTRVTAYVTTGVLKDIGDALLPMHANAALPEVTLARGTVDGSARTKGVNLTLTSRPVSEVSIDVRYKFYDYDNRTPTFLATERVAYDNSIRSTSPTTSQPFGVVRHTLDADVRLTPVRMWTAGAGFSTVREERSYRVFDSTTDNTARLVVDAVGSGWFTLRTKYEHAQRRGTGLNQGVLRLIETGEQPGMRHYDVAERDRDRVTLMGTLMPVDNVSLSLSVAAGQDDFLASPFGLQDNEHRVYTIGGDAAPSEYVDFGVSYAYEDYRALSRHRQANSASDFDDPARDWTTDAHDKVHSVVVNAEIREIRERIDLRFDFDFNRARSMFVYGTAVGSPLNPPEPLPDVLSETTRGLFDATYHVTERVGLGFSYTYEAYRVDDFSLDEDAIPTLDRGRALLLGYIYRPYTANTFWGRLIYHW